MLIFYFGAKGQNLSSDQKAILQAKAGLIINGRVLKREEVWDRRSNSLMGRPDILKEVNLRIKVINVIKASRPFKQTEIKISATEHNRLIILKFAQEGVSGVFYFTDDIAINKISHFERIPNLPKEIAPLTDQEIEKLARDPEKISSKLVFASKPLQQKITREIARRYGLVNASIITLVSYSGPMPPEGGYKYWGVKGQRSGKWFVWQSGKLREGSELTDPKRYQKCNSPDTFIETPSGPLQIRYLKLGDLVLTNNRLPVRILKISRIDARGHFFKKLTFSAGVILEISAGHPTTDGRLFAHLKVGDIIDGKRIIRIEDVPSRFDYTMDILPESDSGHYLANGIWVASTLENDPDSK